MSVMWIEVWFSHHPESYLYALQSLLTFSPSNMETQCNRVENIQIKLLNYLSFDLPVCLCVFFNYDRAFPICCELTITCHVHTVTQHVVSVSASPPV